MQDSVTPTKKVHVFEESLAIATSHRLDKIWECVYRNAFPAFVDMTAYPEAGDHQRSGMDRSIQLAHGKQIWVDEKWRTKAYRTNGIDDILLEYVSNDRTNAPGWVVKPLRADYIAYAIGPRGICYLLPVEQLQLAWKKQGEEWLETYGVKTAHNVGYKTLNCAVPANVLYLAIGNAHRQYFTALSEKEALDLSEGL